MEKLASYNDRFYGDKSERNGLSCLIARPGFRRFDFELRALAPPVIITQPNRGRTQRYHTATAYRGAASHALMSVFEPFEPPSSSVVQSLRLVLYVLNRLGPCTLQVSDGRF